MTSDSVNYPTKGQILRKLRKEAKINQAELASSIGVCRETIINIEKDVPSAINSMSLDNVHKWFVLCQHKCTVETRTTFQSYISHIFDI